MKYVEKNMVPTRKREILVFLLSILVMLVSYMVTQHMVTQNELKNHLQENRLDTKENVIAARNLLDGMVAELSYTATAIEQYDDFQHPEVQKILAFSNKMNMFDVTFISNTEGNVYIDPNNQFNLMGEEYFQRALNSGDVVFSEILPSQRFDGIQIIAYPLYSETHEIKGILFGLFNVETFYHLLEIMVGYEDYLYIVDSNGAYIANFGQESSQQKNTNFWTDLAECDIGDTSLDVIKENFCAGNEGEFFYSDDGVARYGYHMPLGIQDWQIVLTVEKSAINNHVQSIRQIDMIDTLINLICLTVMLLSIYRYFHNANQEIRKAHQIESKNNELMRMAMELSNHIIFEYDIKERKIELKTGSSNPLFSNKVLSPVPDCFFEKNIVASDSVPALKNLFETILTEKSSQAEIQIVTNEQEKIWYRVNMQNIYNDAGTIIGTIGSAEDISMLKKGEVAIQRREEMHASLVLNALVYARVDLSTDTILELNGKETQLGYQEYLHEKILEKVSDQQSSYVAQRLSLDALRKDYEEGKEFTEVQCIMEDEQNSKWVSCVVYRIHKIDSCEVTFVIRDIDSKKRKELALKWQAERDGLTGLYNAMTTRAKVNAILQAEHSAEEKQIFLLFDLDNFKNINDTFGHMAGDQVLVDVADTLKKRFRSGDIMGRLGGDEFVLMLCNVRSDEFVNELMQELCETLTRTYVQDDVSITITASMGLAVAPSDGTTFDELYRKADIALYQIKRAGKNGYMRYN